MFIILPFFLIIENWIYPVVKRQRLYLGCISNSIDATLTKRLLLTLLLMLLLLLMLKLMLTSGESMLHNSRSVAKATITTTTTSNIHLNIDLTCLLDPPDATSPNPIQQCGFNCLRNVADITMNELLVWPMMMATAWLAIRRLSSKLPLNRDWYHRSLTNFGASFTSAPLLSIIFLNLFLLPFLLSSMKIIPWLKSIPFKHNKLNRTTMT